MSAMGCVSILGMGAAVVLALAGAAGSDRPAPASETEQRILGVLKDLDENQRRGMMNVPVEDGRLLRVLTEAIGAKHVVEIGTSNGYSGIWFCLALRTTGGRLTTYELNAERARLARENFKRAGVDGLVTLVEGDAHVEVAKLKTPIDLLFLDADKEGYLDYLNKLLPLVRAGGLILAHNTTDLGAAMQDYLKVVRSHPDLETIFVHEQDRGMGVTLKKRAAPMGTPAGSNPAHATEGAILGYIDRVLPESPEARAARHQKVAQRRQGTPLIAHRGDRQAAPENTLEAYAGAMDLGADGVEIDIRRSKDGVLYLFHDDTLERLTTGAGKVAQLTYHELLSITPKDVYGTATADTRPPTLAAFLVVARQRAMLLHLDVKEPGLQDDIEQMLDAADVWDHVVEVNAGNAERLRSHPKVKLLPYKGWWPEGADASNPDAIRSFLGREGVMVICKDVAAAARGLGRPAADRVPLPAGLRAPWTPNGIAPAPPPR